MKRNFQQLVVSILFFSFLLNGCQVIEALQPTNTPIPATVTPTETQVPSATPSPTATFTPEPTFTPTPMVVNIEAGSTITAPILLYHHISNSRSDSSYNVSPEKFEEQMKWLYENHYSTITVTTLAKLIREGGQIPIRPFIITFDDGNSDIYQNAYPILKKYGFVATFYIVDNYINSSDFITLDQLTELVANGWEIGSHSNSHAHLVNDGADLGSEIRMSKLELEEKLGVTVNSFAYPFGDFDLSIIDKTMRYGYTAAVGLGSSVSHNLNSVYYLSRVEIKEEYDLEKFKSFFPWQGPLQ